MMPDGEIVAHLFISYARADRAMIEKLAAALEAAGHSVWWDRHIRGGAAYADDIEAQLHKADAVIVAWSADAMKSDWVKDEAVFARERGILIPIGLSDGAAPLGFRQYQTLDFQNWRGDRSAQVFQALNSAIAQIMGAASAPVAEKQRTSLINRFKSAQFLVPASLGIAAILGVGAYLFFFAPGNTPRTGANPEIAEGAQSEVSIAVLPFADMSPEGNQEYFADGISEELLNVLVRVDGLKVASRTSSFALKNEALDVSAIAQRLNVNHVLEGSVRKMGNRVRITAQLIDATNDRHLWSETYDRHLADIFRIQDEIATAVVDELRGKLGIDDSEAVVIKTATENMSAYDAYLKARELFIARGAANVRESLRLFEEIVEMDPTFARGWEGLAAVYAIATSWGITDKDYSALALVAARRALEADPDLSMPYAVMGLTYRTHYPTPWQVSIGNLEKAIERDSKNANAWLWLGMNFMAVGAAPDAVAAFNECLKIDDAARLCRKYRAISQIFLGNYDAAIIDAERNAEEGYFSDFDVFIPYFLNKGDRITAFTVSRNIYWWGGFPHRDFIAAIEHPDEDAPGRVKRFLDWAENSRVDILDQTYVMLALRAYDKINVETFDNDYEDLWLPQFSHYRKSREFQRLARDLGLLDYWAAAGFPPQCRAFDDGSFECD